MRTRLAYRVRPGIRKKGSRYPGYVYRSSDANGYGL